MEDHWLQYEYQMYLPPPPPGKHLGLYSFILNLLGRILLYHREVLTVPMPPCVTYVELSYNVPQ